MSDERLVVSGKSDRLASVLDWDWGTAYEMVLSLRTLFHPKQYGLPAPWAAGVRKRISAQAQRELKDFYNPPFAFIAYAPFHLILEMQGPKNSTAFLDFVEAIPDQDFSRRMFWPRFGEPAFYEITARALAGEGTSEADIEDYRRAMEGSRFALLPTATEVRRLFADMAEPATTKKRWLRAMREYHTEFFAEEEVREAPALEKMLAQAQALATTVSVPDLIEQLSNGFTISRDMELKRLVLVPSIWHHPFVVNQELDEHEVLLIWGAHPAGFKLVPGESVPSDAMLVLRALNDPTRLRLLRLIASEPRSLISLAHEVKLSLPTVSHHIRELRGAGLIRLEVAGKGRESNYTVRWSSAQNAFDDLERFVRPESKRHK
ncbi:MAG TPA: winged helix-turn-helix domain-containing protein [Chloroflexia bacterium]|nr:winged helix-turn-helix domain-containing protein [Chloroflexia bacterium]